MLISSPFIIMGMQWKNEVENMKRETLKHSHPLKQKQQH